MNREAVATAVAAITPAATAPVRVVVAVVAAAAVVLVAAAMVGHSWIDCP